MCLAVHSKKADLLPVFNYFRFVANEAIRIGVEKNLTSKFNLHYELYYKLRSEYHCKYVYGALECAASRFKNYKKTLRKNLKTKTPYISKNHLLLNNESYKISDGQIRIPINPRQYYSIKLNHYVLEQIRDAKIGSITLTEDKLIISYSKEVSSQKPTDFVAVDRNLNNATTFDTQNKFITHDLQKANEIKNHTDE
jgi:hypothetical protein